MSEVTPESPHTAQDEGDTNPDSLAGEDVEPEHDLDVDTFEEEGEDEQ